MTSAVLDTNVILQATFSPPQSASTRTLKALDAGKFQLAVSPATLDELLEVLRLPQMRAKHGMNDREILRFVRSFLVDALLYPDQPLSSPSLPRDLTDTKFLSLAQVAEVDYLVTNDRRHLLRLKQHGGTQIVTPAQFLRELG